MHRRLLFVAALLCITASALAAEGFHKWYDENGQVVYSQFAPPEGRDGEVVEPPPPPAEDPAVAQRRLQEQQQRTADFLEDKELASEKAAEQQAALDRDQERCARARENLRLLTGRSRQLFQMPDGTVTRLSEEERQARRAEMQTIIDESCP